MIMSAKLKTVIKGFDYMHCDDFAKYLMEMAAKGWHFKEWGIGLKFEKGEPAQVTYAVEVFTKASEQDLRPEPDTEEFAEYCEAAGWEFVDSKQKFCVFRKKEADAVPLFTQEERVNNVVKGTFSTSARILLVLYGINAVLQWVNLCSFFEKNIFSGVFLFSFSIWNVLFVGQLIAFVYAWIKKHILLKKLRRGELIHIGNRVDGGFSFDWKNFYIACIVFLLTYYFFAMDQMWLVVMNGIVIVGAIVFAVVLNKFRPDYETNILWQGIFSIVMIVAIVVFSVTAISSDETKKENEQIKMPVVITDYREEGEDLTNVYHTHNANILGSMDYYYGYGTEVTLSYRVYKSEYSMILDKIWEDFMEEMEINEEVEDVTADWHADKAISTKGGWYYVRYENAFLMYKDESELDLTKNQIDVILEKLELR